MKLSKQEKETIISFNEIEETATIYSCSKKIWNKCEKSGYEQIDTGLNSDENIVSKTYETVKKNISFRKLRVLTYLQKEKLRDRTIMMRTHSEDSGNFFKDNIVED